MMPNAHLLRLSFFLKIPQHGECLLEINDMMLGSSPFNKHVVHVYLHIFVDLLFEDLIDEPLIGRIYIL